MNAPGHGTQRSAPCPNCGKSLVWHLDRQGYEEVRAKREASR